MQSSRIAGGECPLHQELERDIADLVGAEDCIVYLSGFLANVTTIGYLFGPKDLIVHDSLMHNSAVQGVLLSHAKRMAFPHNDYEALDRLLAEHRRNYERVLVITEGMFSMDGDYPDVPKFIEVKKRHKAYLMVDEAHSIGVVGDRGLGVKERYNLDTNNVDIWMGSLSNALASCGGYIAGKKELVENLKVLGTRLHLHRRPAAGVHRGLDRRVAADEGRTVARADAARARGPVPSAVQGTRPEHRAERGAQCDPGDHWIVTAGPDDRQRDGAGRHQRAAGHRAGGRGTGRASALLPLMWSHRGDGPSRGR